MIVRRISILCMGLILVSAVGCHSIHSGAVRDLIQVEGTKIDAAQDRKSVV